ncbi:MAG: arsenate reductase (glutaredoxin) [Pusillimonas sp.]
MDNITIYHNPKCGTSRNALALIRHTGIEPQIIEYLRSPPSRATLAGLIKQAGLTVREALRTKESPYAEQGLDNPELSDDQLLDAMIAYPVLINRPFVSTPKGVRLCRPVETALEILPAIDKPFTKENGEVIGG